MEQIDYRLTDSLLDEPESQKLYVEELVYLPGGLICYSPPDFAPPVGPLPALANGYITFGVFNNSSKINPELVALWARILKANDKSRLLLKSRGGQNKALRDYYYDQFERFGISPDRIDIQGQKRAVEYLQLFNRVDIALDTYPYNGCMTTLEGLWMGVPIVSLLGENYVSRAALSMLTRIGLEFFVASRPKEYVAKACALAQNPEALLDIRYSMRRRMTSGTLCNAKVFAHSVEAAYRKMWYKWCQEQGVDIPKEVSRADDELQFTVGKNGTPRINLSTNNMPQFLIEANAAVEAGRIDEAAKLLGDRNIETIRQMVQENACRTDVMFMLALMFFSAKDFHNSEIWFKEILEKQPHALVYHELGRICMFTGRMSEAMQYREKAMKADPENAGICGGYAADLMRIGDKKKGIELFRKAVETAPADPLIHSQLLWNLSFLPDVNPLMLLDEHKKWAHIHAPVSLARTSHSNSPDPDRRLRVGYISPDFRKHSVAYNFETFLDGSDRQAVESYGYGSIGLRDEVTERLKQKFDHYRHIRGLSDEVVAEMIADNQIDILVEIGGHTVDNRLGVLAYKPAPIQVDYGGISTMGMPQIDYRLTDSILDSQESQKFYTEESVYLPGGQICYKPPEFAPPVGPPPATRNGYITFASFNNSCKITDNIMVIWAQILRANENSRLLMKFRGGYDRSVKDYYCGRFEQLGIDRNRVGTCGWKSSIEHLQLYSQVDIALDTYPYTGTMTSLEAMWMGVPVISLYGDHKSYFLSRVGLSILGRIGLEFFACPTPAEYIAKATALSRNPEALTRIRASMRIRMANSTLCDARAYAASVEAAYRNMWHKWCRSRNDKIRTDTS
jgi:predicted O-linked N-acetylglucosamine transferase (SPINDLY family)